MKEQIWGGENGEDGLTTEGTRDKVVETPHGFGKTTTREDIKHYGNGTNGVGIMDMIIFFPCKRRIVLTWR
jgi:hypothetical protein